jgi:ABC-type amino acid transport substrate-binding protein
MKLSCLSVFVVLLYPSPCSSFTTNSCSNLCRALHKATTILNLNVASTINFITSDNGSFNAKEFFTDVSKSSGLVCRRETASGIKKAPLKRKRRFTAFGVESFSDFEKIYEKIDDKMFRFGGFYIILLVNGEILEVQKMFELLWQLQIYNVNVMFEDENGEVLVKTFMPFSTGKCGDTTPVLTNKFKDGKFRNSGDFFPKKLKNLHQCPIRIAITNDNEPYTIEEFLPNGTRLLSGRDIEVSQALAKSLNFKVDFSFVGPVGFFLTNGSSQGALKSIMDNESDLSVTNWWLKENRINFLDFSLSYGSTQIVFIVPPGRQLTAVEKLFFPFKLTTWIFILLVLVVGFLVICVVKFQSTAIKNFVYGTGVKAPVLNLLGAFIGGTQKKLPGRNFARFLLMMFLIYSLVIRSIYQGSFYKLLNSNQHLKEVQTISEMIEKNFEFYVYEGHEDLFQSTKEIARRMINKTATEWKPTRLRVINGLEESSAFEFTTLTALYWNEQNDADNQMKICREIFVTVPEVIYTKKNFFLLDEINEALNQLVESGLIEFWTFQSNRSLKETTIPKVLSFSQVRGAFGVLFVGSIISLITFAGEVSLKALLVSRH